MTSEVTIRALIDSSADATVLPRAIIDQLVALPVDEWSVSSYDGVTEQKYIYAVNLAVLDLEPQPLKVITVKGTRHALVGRDIIH